MGIIAWIDLETTGTDEYDDPILEVGLIITTDRNLTEITRRSWTVIPRSPERALERMNAVPAVLAMHMANGLHDEVTRGVGTLHATVVEEVVATIGQHHTGRGRVPLGGSGVSHFDHRFLAAQMPQVSEMLTYWAYDIGAARRFGKLCGIEAPAEASDASQKTHRALDDIEMHVNEARWWMRFLRATKAEGVLRDLKREDAAGE